MDWRIIVGEVVVGLLAGIGLMCFSRIDMKTIKLIQNFPLDSKILTQFSLGITTVLIFGGILFFLFVFSEPYFPLNWIVPTLGALFGFSPFLIQKPAKKEGDKDKNKEG